MFREASEVSSKSDKGHIVFPLHFPNSLWVVVKSKHGGVGGGGIGVSPLHCSLLDR